MSQKSLKVFSSVGVAIIALLTGALAGLFYFYPGTQADALISKVSGIESVYTRSVDPLVTTNTARNAISDVEPKPYLVELPTEYYKKPIPPTSTPVQDLSPANSQSQIIQLAYTQPQHSGIPSSISIPAIGLSNITFSEGTLYDVPDIEQKLTYGPVRDTGLTQEPCLPNSHTYLMGHSEPAYSWQASYPGGYIFNKLHTLQPGDRIYATNSKGSSCTYEVTGWESITTVNDRVEPEVFHNVLFPDTSSSSILSIQTCQLGSATVRLILRSKMV